MKGLEFFSPSQHPPSSDGMGGQARKTHPATGGIRLSVQVLKYVKWFAILTKNGELGEPWCG